MQVGKHTKQFICQSGKMDGPWQALAMSEYEGEIYNLAEGLMVFANHLPLLDVSKLLPCP